MIFEFASMPSLNFLKFSSFERVNHSSLKCGIATFYRDAFICSMLSAVVIEEDLQQAQHLAALLEDTWQVDVLRTATDSCAGLDLCGESRPDVVFLDIDVYRRNGESLGELTQIAQPARLVFTARDADRAIDAFRFDAFDFLQKPLDPTRVAETVDRLADYLRPLRCNPVPQPTQRIRGVTGFGKGFTDTIDELMPVPGSDRDQIRLLARREIVAVLRRGRRTWIHTVLEEFATYYPLTQVLRWLRGDNFIQIGRHAIINLRALRGISRYGDRACRVQLQDRLGTEITASRTGAARLVGILKRELWRNWQPDNGKAQTAGEIIPVGIASTATGTKEDELDQKCRLF
jgi:two-component system, LytTR family, response regulator LytT